MADPNTQIDWWIAQAWQEAQGGAENDALVIWLHENGLTAVSSYTILQAALSCPPETAKEIVFSHPVWAGEDPDADVDNLNYTNDTLEPEPEPDGAFELEGWAEEVEEDAPVYGEEGYEPEPGAGAAPPPSNANPQESAKIQDAILREIAQVNNANPSQGSEEEDGLGDASVLGDDADGSDLAPLEPGPIYEPDLAPAPMDDMPAAPEPDPLETEPIHEPPAPAPMQGDLDASMDAMPATPEPVPEPPVAPPVIRKPPSTPSERAAMFAGAFGKKPAAAPPPPNPAPQAPSPETPPGESGDDPPMSPPPLPREPGAAYQDFPLPSENGAPSALAMADAVLAEEESELPQLVMQPVPVSPPLVYEPFPDIDLPQSVASTEPLFSSPKRDPQLAPPLFPLDTPGQPVADAASLAHVQPADPEAMESNGEARPEQADEPESPFAPDAADALDEPEPAVAMDDPGNLPPGMLAAMGQGEAEPPDEEAGEPASADWARELPALDEKEEDADENVDEVGYLTEEYDPGFSSLKAHDGEAEDGAPRPQKRLLLDPSAEPDRGGIPVDSSGEIPLGDSPDEMAEAARKLGIDFRGDDLPSNAVDPEMAKVAKQLGISFRDSSANELQDAELADAALKLGISFRDEDLTPNKPPKPLIVKYLPMLFVLCIVIVLILLGVQFSGELMVLLWS